jgi:hypothetical protein
MAHSLHFFCPLVFAPWDGCGTPGKLFLGTILVSLMKSTVFRDNSMKYRDRAFRYDSDMLQELESEFVRELSEGKQYSKKRSRSPKRRKAPRAIGPDCGIARRRQHRWSW